MLLKKLNPIQSDPWKLDYYRTTKNMLHFPIMFVIMLGNALLFDDDFEGIKTFQWYIFFENLNFFWKFLNPIQSRIQDSLNFLIQSSPIRPGLGWITNPAD